jgi:hypothetical protein
MKMAPKPLPNNLDQLKEMLLSERSLCAEKDDEIVNLKQQYQNLLEQRSGPII